MKTIVIRAIGTLVLVPMIGSVGAPAAQQVCDVPRIITELGSREQVPERLSLAPGAVTEYPSAAQSGAKYIRAQVKVEDPPDCEWFLSVRDKEYRLIHTFGRQDFPGTGVRPTRRIAGDRVLFDLQPCSDRRAPSVSFPEYTWMPDRATVTYYSLQTQGNEAFKNITDVPTPLRRLGDSTGMLMSSFLRDAWSCTGVMLTPDLFLTNWHCGGPGKVRSSGPGGGTTSYPVAGYWTPQILADTLIDLSWDGDPLSRELTVTGTDVAAHSVDLDYAVLRVQALDKLGPIRSVKISTATPARNDSIRIVHHPAGRVKQMSFNCEIRNPNRGGWKQAGALSEFSHVCDTEAGSSGAPVLTDQNELVGLHHLGFDFDGACNSDRENKAIKISEILSHLLKNFPLVHAEILRWQ